ncbi:hypothetical protein DAPPUDRAFT_125672, partial [Daphnia pulex]
AVAPQGSADEAVAAAQHAAVLHRHGAGAAAADIQVGVERQLGRRTVNQDRALAAVIEADKGLIGGGLACRDVQDAAAAAAHVETAAQVELGIRGAQVHRAVASVQLAEEQFRSGQLAVGADVQRALAGRADLGAGIFVGDQIDAVLEGQRVVQLAKVPELQTAGATIPGLVRPGFETEVEGLQLAAVVLDIAFEGERAEGARIEGEGARIAAKGEVDLDQVAAGQAADRPVGVVVIEEQLGPGGKGADGPRLAVDDAGNAPVHSGGPLPVDLAGPGVGGRRGRRQVTDAQSRSQRDAERQAP